MCHVITFEAGRVDHLPEAKGALDPLFRGLLSPAFVFEAPRTPLLVWEI